MYVLSQLFVPAFVALFLPAGRERGLQSICFLACSRRSDSGVQCKVREREKNSRNLRPPESWQIVSLNFILNFISVAEGVITT